MTQSQPCYVRAGLTALIVFFLSVAANADSGGVLPNTPDLRRAGIVITSLQRVSMAPSILALGEVFNPGPVIQLAGQIATLDAQVSGAKAKVVLEIQQQGQASALYQRHVLALAEYQKAEQDLASSQSALAVDQAKRTALLAQTEAEWGSTMATVLRTNADPLPQLATGKTVLVGLSFPPGVTLANPPAHAEAQAAGKSFVLHLISPVPSMIGAYPGQGILYQAEEQAGLPIGTIVSASLPSGPERKGVLVPSSAVTWQDGHSLAYRVNPDNRFESVPVATDEPTDGGYFVTGALSPGDRVVIHGAVLLLGLGNRSDPNADGD